MAHIAGGARLSLNERGATPNALSMFTRDIVSVRRMSPSAIRSPARPMACSTTRARGSISPRSSTRTRGVEYWGGGRSAALIHTAAGRPIRSHAAGQRAHVFPDRHAALAAASFRRARQRVSSARIRSSTGGRSGRSCRAWIAGSGEGALPPPSQYPRLTDGTLVRADQIAFPVDPGRAVAAHHPGRTRRYEAAAVPRPRRGRGWQRARRHQNAGARRAGRDLYRLELQEPVDRRARRSWCR